MTLAKQLKLKKTTFIFYLLLLVWADIFVTFFGLAEIKSRFPDVWTEAEMSLTVSPMIKRFGLEYGMLISGFINSLLIFTIAIIFPNEFAYGVFSGMFILAVAINLRLLYGL